MPHTLKITVGAKALAHSLLTLPEQFKTPAELLRAGRLMELLATHVVKDSTENELLQLVDVEVTEAQRDLLKASCTFGASKIPPSVFAISLLEALGFE